MDDDLAFAQMIGEYFGGRYHVLTANNLDEAIRCFRRHRPKVVLLDFSMPLLNGDQCLPVLQELDPTVRAIVITGCRREEVEQKFKGLGYYALFEKGAMSLEDVALKVDEAFHY